jgi:hypothetical protein
LQTKENIIGTITKQLLRRLPNFPENFPDKIAAIWGKSCKKKEPLKLTQAIEAFSDVCKQFGQTFICLDALDECQDMSGLLGCLRKASSTVRIFSTGRTYIRETIETETCLGRTQTQTIYIEAKESDIQVLVKERIQEDSKKDPSLMNEDLERHITEKVSALSKGM